MESKFTKLLVLFLNIHTIYGINTIEVKNFFIQNNLVCETSGIKCHDCWSSLNCIDLGNGTLYPELQHCSIGRSCKSASGVCESEGNYECTDTEKLKCNTEGTFPSPFNSQEYFMCVRRSDGMLQKFFSKCPSPYMFDASKKLCRKTTDKIYNSSIPICQYEEQKGPFGNHSNIFYRCEKDKVDVGFNLVPQLYGCPFNFRFNGTVCVDPEPEFLDENGHCLMNGLFADPKNCAQYYNCYVGQSPSVEGCYNYQKFDQLQGQCVYYDCNECYD